MSKDYFQSVQYLAARGAGYSAVQPPGSQAVKYVNNPEWTGYPAGPVQLHQRLFPEDTGIPGAKYLVGLNIRLRIPYNWKT